MKTFNYIFASLILALLMLSACEPNKELYEDLDAELKPYNEKIEYTLTDADYTSLTGAIKQYKAFNDTAMAMDYVPAILAKKFVALNLGSAAKVSYNFMVVDTVKAWEKVIFGYTLTAADYNAIGGFVATYDYFFNTPGYLAKDYLPNYLPNLYPTPKVKDSVVIIYNFNPQGNIIIPNADWYKYDTISGNTLGWIYQRTITELIECDIVFDAADYAEMGNSTPYFPNISTAERKIPIWLKDHFKYADEGDTKIVQYEYSATGGHVPKAVQFEYNGSEWIKLIGHKIEVRSEQYVFSQNGWVFDPTIRFKMGKADYTYIAENDPISHPKYSDLGYYYGASGNYSNFDMRVQFFHLKPYTNGTIIYTPEENDPELWNLYNNEGADAVTELLFQRILQEGLILLLEHKFPTAKPLSEGVEVHYVVQFETYHDDLSRGYLEAEYKCVTAATGVNSAKFEFVDGPRPRSN